MKAYFIRRLLLVLPTMLGITFLVFTVSRFAPGGPMDSLLQAAVAGGDDQGSSSDSKSSKLSPEAMERAAEDYGFDKVLPHAYAQWLGVMPKEKNISKYNFKGDSIIEGRDGQNYGQFALIGTDALVELKLKRSGTGDDMKVEVKSFNFLGTDIDPRENGWEVRIESPEEQREIFANLQKIDKKDVKINHYRAVVFKNKFSGLVQGDLGRSHTYNDTVWSMILNRVPISLYFGVLSTIIIYFTCIPLGMLKAIKHKSIFDSLSSVLIFVGYAIPGYALGALLVVFLGARLGWFPIFGLTSENFHEMSAWGQFIDVAHHTVLPIICYVVSGFAFLTMMMKNNLMDNLSADYVRTAMAKGVSFPKAVIGHAFRNSFIPIATGLGGLISLFVGGSMLIEQVFDIQGFGKLQFEAVQAVDIPVIMGTLTISSFLMLMGNILSDVIVSFVDPRIKFN